MANETQSEVVPYLPKKTDNPISRALQAYQKAVPSPLLHAALLGAGAYGLTRLGWRPIVETTRSLARIPGRSLGGMSDREWDEAMDELGADPSLSRWIPVAIGALAAGGTLAAHYRPNKQYGGLLSWNANTKYYKNPADRFLAPDTSNQFTQPMKMENVWLDSLRKTSSLSKEADSPYLYGNYVPTTDFAKALNASSAVDLFVNDPYLQNQDYVRNLGTSIVTNAAMREGTSRPTLGSVFDSAVDKIDKKLSFEGLASVGVKSLIANSAARLFTSALGAMTDLDPDARQNIIDTGTWAGAITAILE